MTYPTECPNEECRWESPAQGTSGRLSFVGNPGIVWKGVLDEHGEVVNAIVCPSCGEAALPLPPTKHLISSTDATVCRTRTGEGYVCAREKGHTGAHSSLTDPGTGEAPCDDATS